MSLNSRRVELPSGILELEITRSELSLDELLGFAARANPKRGFLFVSKVLGKHIPCSPSKMRAIYHKLAQLIGSRNTNTFVIGMAETATGLGAGVADSLARQHVQQNLSSRLVSYQHTTRHITNGSLWITFDESHSHAPDHLLYQPQGEAKHSINKARSLVLVDDEITSGRTLTELTQAIAKQWSGSLDEVCFVSIVSWLTPEKQREIQSSLKVPIRFISLLEGCFSFTPHPQFQPQLPGQVRALNKVAPARSDLGRHGLIPLLHLSRTRLSSLVKKSLSLNPKYPVTVVGTGEFAYQPFLLAEALEEAGFDVLYQSSTRSPILIGGAITASLAVNDERGEGVSNYLHNPPQAVERQIIVVYEDQECAQHHQLPNLLNAHRWVWTLPETEL